MRYFSARWAASDEHPSDSAGKEETELTSDDETLNAWVESLNDRPSFLLIPSATIKHLTVFHSAWGMGEEVVGFRGLSAQATLVAYYSKDLRKPLLEKAADNNDELEKNRDLRWVDPFPDWDPPLPELEERNGSDSEDGHDSDEDEVVYPYQSGREADDYFNPTELAWSRAHVITEERDHERKGEREKKRKPTLARPEEGPDPATTKAELRNRMRIKKANEEDLAIIGKMSSE